MTGTRARFVITICAGSFLLFLVQPMIARMALPRLGGAPSVWNSAMLVYQALLLAGYGYAHMLGRVPARRQAIIHLSLFLLSAVFLPIGLAGWQPPAGTEPALWVLWLLGASIGPLFFVVAAQAPLLQRWYALSAGEGSDPYPLYAASNLGSFAGLLAYPLLVEPLLTLKAQSILWSLCYAALFFLVYMSARRLPQGSPGETPAMATDAPLPGARVMLHWLALAAVPSGLMLATSLYLTTDIVAMPLLWILPLGLYLLSFSLAFAVRRGGADLCLTIAPLILLIGACIAFTGGVNFPVFIAIGILAVLFVAATALHARLYELRPAPVHLTRFYLLMSVGGMLGGLFCALIAPLIFDWTYEYPILLAAAALLLPAREATLRLPRLIWEDPGRRVWLAAAMMVAGLALSVIGGGMVPALKIPLVKTACFLTIIVMGILALGHRWLIAAMLIYLMLCLSGWEKLSQSASGILTRSYFGVYGVANRDTTERILFHGTTLHGVQRLTPGRERDATSYYAPESGVGQALRRAPLLYGPHARIDVVGLGAGTLACYVRPGQSWRFYEIDPAMVAIARNPDDFSFLSRCQPRADIVIGDARMTLGHQAAGGADILVIDAFSSDSIPMHLLTREAFGIYGRRIARDGLLLIHISNRYLDLRPVIAAQAKAGGWQARIRNFTPSVQEKARFQTASVWIALSRDPARLNQLALIGDTRDWQPLLGRRGFAPWTDDHASILPVLKIKP